MYKAYLRKHNIPKLTRYNKSRAHRKRRSKINNPTLFLKNYRTGQKEKKEKRRDETKTRTIFLEKKGPGHSS